MTTPIWLIPALVATFLASIPVVILLLRPYMSKLTPEQRQAILGAVKGAKDVLSVVAPITPTDLDDKILEAFKIMETEFGKPLTAAEKQLAHNTLVSLVARDHASTGEDNREMAAKLHKAATTKVKT